MTRVNRLTSRGKWEKTKRKKESVIRTAKDRWDKRGGKEMMERLGHQHRIFFWKVKKVKVWKVSIKSNLKVVQTVPD